MNELVLWLPAFILPLFCLIYSLAVRRKLYLPLPKGLSAKLRNHHTVFLLVLCVLIIAAAFSVAEAISGTGTPNPVRIAGIALRIILLGLLALYIWAVPKTDRRAAVILAAVAVFGVLARVVWSAPVDLFFASVSAFGCMVMLEREEDTSETGTGDRFRAVAMTAVAAIFLMVIAMNVVLIFESHPHAVR